MAEMEELLQVPQIDVKLPDFLNLAFYNLSAEDIYLREGLHDALKDHVYARLNKYQRDFKADRFSKMLSNISFDLFSMSENSLARTYADVFLKFRKDYLGQNQYLSELQNNSIFLDVYSKFIEIKTAYDRFSECLANEKDVSAIKPDIEKISKASVAYNDAVKEMANIFVEQGIVPLEDVSDPESGGTPEYLHVLNRPIQQLNDFLTGPEGLDDEKMIEGLREINGSFDGEIFDNVLGHIRYMYTGDKNMGWSDLFCNDHHSEKSSKGSLFGLLHHLNFPSEYPIQFWEGIFDGLGFEIQKSEGHLIANIGFKDFMNLNLQVAEKN